MWHCNVEALEYGVLEGKEEFNILLAPSPERLAAAGASLSLIQEGDNLTFWNGTYLALTGQDAAAWAKIGQFAQEAGRGQKTIVLLPPPGTTKEVCERVLADLGQPMSMWQPE